MGHVYFALPPPKNIVFVDVIVDSTLVHGGEKPASPPPSLKSQDSGVQIFKPLDYLKFFTKLHLTYFVCSVGLNRLCIHLIKIKRLLELRFFDHKKHFLQLYCVSVNPLYLMDFNFMAEISI